MTAISTAALEAADRAYDDANHALTRADVAYEAARADVRKARRRGEPLDALTTARTTARVERAARLLALMEATDAYNDAKDCAAAAKRGAT